MSKENEVRLEDILPAEYFIKSATAELLDKEPVYVIDDEWKRVATHGGWDYYNINWNGQRVARHGSEKWLEFSNAQAAENFVTNILKRNLEDFSFQYVNQERVAEICKT